MNMLDSVHTKAVKQKKKEQLVGATEEVENSMKSFNSRVWVT